MEDNQIRDLFKGFNPDLGSNESFFRRLESNMTAIESIKAEAAATKRRTRYAVAVAGVCGFVVGAVMSFVLSMFSTLFVTVTLSIPRLPWESISINLVYVAWLAIATLSCVVGVNAYEITMAKLPRKS